MITLTENAVKQLREMLGSEPGEARGLRLLIERGGCAGWQYAMKIDQPAVDDVVIETGGVRVYVASDSLDLLRDAEVDYVDDLSDTGFKIHNPNAARSCGCGSSFEAEQENSKPARDTVR
ncbi:MAG: HesB/IscA family protein [Verrucomicrobiales bacterium]